MSLTSMFAEHRTLRAVIESVLEGRIGSVVVDDDSRPRAARLDVGCYAIFGGDPTGAHPMVADVRSPVELLGPDRQPWRDLFAAVHGDRLSDRPMRTFSSHALDKEQLRQLATAVPEKFELRRLDREMVSQLDDSLTPHGLQTYTSPEHFVEAGVGFGIVTAGRLVSVASSYACSRARVEIAIATAVDFRGRGLARCVAAKLIAWSLDHELLPDWSAANPVSKRLAGSLGYLPARLCDVFFLESGSAPPVTASTSGAAG